jgi:hypothetical protein
MYTILNEGQEQGLWETLASMTYPQILLIWLKIRIRTWKTATMTRMSSKMQNYFIVTFNCLFVFMYSRVKNGFLPRIRTFREITFFMLCVTRILKSYF